MLNDIMLFRMMKKWQKKRKTVLRGKVRLGRK